MADWNGTARSNYFQVKNEAAFRTWAKQRDLHVFERVGGDHSPKRFGFYSEDQYGGWPSYSRELEEQTGDGTIDLAAEVAEHLRDGEVAILMEVGAEKCRCVTGIAIAVASTGESVVVDLDDIYKSAASILGVPEDRITLCNS